ncbi:MAG: DUF3352 domain-containing protein [Chloroflexota bacterium]|nr:DUF3352 domain-containing protein [Chloroflexota bacterium]
MPRAPQRFLALLPVAWTATVGRVSLAVLFALAMLVPVLGRAIPAAAQASTVSFSTAEAAPADSVAYLVTTLNDESEQWRLADVLIDRAGFGDALDQARAEEMTDESGEALPLDAFLGGEIGVVLDAAALDTLAAESMGAADLEAMLGSMGMATPEAAPTALAAQGFAAVLDARAPDTAWTGIRDSIVDGAFEESTYEGTQIYFKPAAGPDEEGMAAARAGDLILIGLTPMDLHPIIDTVDGRSEAITTLPEFSTARDALPQEFLMFGFANNAAVMNADLGPFAMAAGDDAAAFSALTISASEPGFRMETVGFAAEGETLPAGVANFESDLVNLAPAETLLFMSAADLGATGVLDAIGAGALALAFGMGGMGETPDPSASAEEFIAGQYEAAAALIGINLQTDLFQQLSGEYGAWLAAGPAGDNVSGLFASDAADPEAVSNSLMQLSFLIQGAMGAEAPLTTREVDGGQIYVIELGDEAGSTFEFGVAGDRFVLGSGDAIDRLAGTGEGSLADDTLFQSVMDTLPVERSGLFYIDLEQAIPLGEVAAEQSGDLALGGFDTAPDASESCGTYATQEEAQTAYDAAESGTFDLDQDFDGQVCEDFFVSAETPAAGTDDAASAMDATEVLADVDYSAIKAFGLAAYEDGGLQRSSSILYISE